jgi:hypothetical protein
MRPRCGERRRLADLTIAKAERDETDDVQPEVVKASQPIRAGVVVPATTDPERTQAARTRLVSHEAPSCIEPASPFSSAIPVPWSEFGESVAVIFQRGRERVGEGSAEVNDGLGEAQGHQ